MEEIKSIVNTEEWVIANPVTGETLDTTKDNWKSPMNMAKLIESLSNTENIEESKRIQEETSLMNYDDILVDAYKAAKDDTERYCLLAWHTFRMQNPVPFYEKFFSDQGVPTDVWRTFMEKERRAIRSTYSEIIDTCNTHAHQLAMLCAAEIKRSFYEWPLFNEKKEWVPFLEMVMSTLPRLNKYPHTYHMLIYDWEMLAEDRYITFTVHANPNAKPGVTKSIHCGIDLSVTRDFLTVRLRVQSKNVLPRLRNVIPHPNVMLRDLGVRENKEAAHMIMAFAMRILSVWATGDVMVDCVHIYRDQDGAEDANDRIAVNAMKKLFTLKRLRGHTLLKYKERVEPKRIICEFHIGVPQDKVEEA
jgi:hypothetical protein